MTAIGPEPPPAPPLVEISGLDATSQLHTIFRTVSCSAMDSSRIFVRGLPPNFTEGDVRKHFAKFPVTDVKHFPARRIGYVGYKTPQDAAKAIKYFNKSFIRMTKIHVETARPVSCSERIKRGTELMRLRSPIKTFPSHVDSRRKRGVSLGMSITSHRPEMQFSSGRETSRSRI